MRPATNIFQVCDRLTRILFLRYSIAAISFAFLSGESPPSSRRPLHFGAQTVLHLDALPAAEPASA
jgi:hypothetical protein